MSSDSSPISRLRSGRTYWVRSNLTSPAKDSAYRSPNKQGSRKRFVEPVRLTGTQRAEILSLLERRSIGDAESRNLFVSAMEYDLAGCDMGNQTPNELTGESAGQATASTNEMLAELGAAAETLAQRLAALDEAKAKHLLQQLSVIDPFKRLYSEPYLTALHIELKQIVTVTKPSTLAANVATTTTPALSDAARRFVERTADAFRDCFEEEPTIERGSPFLTAFEAVVIVSGVNAPIDPVTIREILA